MTLNELRAAADRLPPADRADLASHLIHTLDDGGDDPAVAAAEWAAVVEDRRLGMEAGLRPAVPADEVFRWLRERRS